MDPVPPFDYAYDPSDIAFGRGRAADLGELLYRHGIERGLVVCGSNVGANDALMEPLRAGMDDRLAGVFDGTTPDKSVEGAYGAVERMAAVDADGIVAVGGGSSLDVGRAARILAADHRPLEELRAEVASRGRVDLAADADLPPMVGVPTTLAGADLSFGGSVVVPRAGGEGNGQRAGISDPRLMPTALCYDPALFETTPESALVGSAMNGFNKGVEALYARDAAPITDATAARGLGLLAAALPRVPGAEDSAVMERVVAGILLVQYGRARPGTNLLSVIHAYGHGLSRGYPLQQGTAHAVAAPHVLRDLFGAVDGRRDLLASALGRGDAADPGAAAADAVASVRDSLGLPSRLRDVDGPDHADLPAVADAVREDGFMSNAPEGYDPSVERIEGTLEAMW